jgi:radical SAM-linked protein
MQNPRELFLYWFRYTKLGRIRFFGQLELAQGFARAIRRAGLPAAYSQGFHPHIKLSFDEALPLGLESEVEEAHLNLTQEMNPRTVQSVLNLHLPQGLRVDEMVRVTKRLRQPQCRTVTYRIWNLEPWSARHILQTWSRRLGENVARRTKTQEVCATLGEVLLDIRQGEDSSLEMDIRETAHIRFRPLLILQHLLGESVDCCSGCRIRKVASYQMEVMEGKQTCPSSLL